MERLIFSDNACPGPYDFDSLDKGGIGGTEATVLRVAEALADKYQVTIQQRRRLDKVEQKGIWFVPYEKLDYKPSRVVTLRDSKTYATQRALYPSASHFLWLHDLPTKELFQFMPNNSTLVCVSGWHKGITRNALMQHAAHTPIEAIRTEFIYNPVDKDLEYKKVDYDPYKLTYFSSPHKGLGDTFLAFAALRGYDNRYTLHVANPGYFQSVTDMPDGCVNMGVLSHKSVLEQVRSSLAVFSINRIFPETFGLVYAEADTVGTPTLTHNIGAAQEILAHRHEIINTRDLESVIRRIEAWSNGERPIVRQNSDFSIGEVKRKWLQLLK